MIITPQDFTLLRSIFKKIIFRRSMSPYVAKKYGHLLEKEEDTESILKERVGNRITNQNIYRL